MNQAPELNSGPRLFLAGIGMVTPVGGNTALTTASVTAGVSAYSASQYRDKRTQRIIMANVPTEVFMSLDADIDSGQHSSAQHERVIRMAIIALNEACSSLDMDCGLPLALAAPEPFSQNDFVNPAVLTENLANNCRPWIEQQLCRSFHSGRAAGIEALDFAYHYLLGTDNDYLLIGGSDCHRHYSRLDPLDAADRLLSAGAQDGFAPGEGATFLLLTPRPEKALVRNGYIIGIGRPGLAQEPGHFYSDEPYLGEGLDKAFKLALAGEEEISVERIYSSMNGESYWAKEYGVALLRNRAAFAEDVSVEHPADAYGDLGAATAPSLMALAATELWRRATHNDYLVYSSSDYGLRGAVVLSKIKAA